MTVQQTMKTSFQIFIDMQVIMFSYKLIVYNFWIQNSVN